MLRRARDRIDRDYAGQIDIPALAAGAGYSREHFIRAFRTAYGDTPGMSPTAYREKAAERGGPAPIPGCFALMWQARPAGARGRGTHHFLRSAGPRARRRVAT